ncbi:MAG: tyrosine-type recombinase/integrase [Victivallaceae bacterium]
MAKRKIVLPKLFERGKKGLLYFRRQIGGKDQYISTKTADKAVATAFVERYMKVENATEVANHTQESAPVLVQRMVQSLTGTAIERITLEDGFKIFEEHTPDLRDLAKTSQLRYPSVYNMFVSWCKANEMHFMDEIEQTVALKYARHLWDSQMTPRTFNDHVKFLSRLFETIDVLRRLPNRNPFHSRIVKRKRIIRLEEASHKPLEPDMMKKVLACAAKAGQDFLDLFIIGSQTGMRLKDAALFKWETIKDGFIEIVPEKTKKSGNTARIPISKVLDEMLCRRNQKIENEYVVPIIAKYYNSGDWINRKSQEIFIEAIGKEKVYLAKGVHRRRDTALYSFHSFRTTFMSLLATKDISARDAMRMMGWESPEMIRVYEKMLDDARGDADRRAFEYISSLTELNYEIPKVESVLKPNPEALSYLVKNYSNVTIGKVYGISETAVRNWMVKFGIKRAVRIESADMTNEEIEKIRSHINKFDKQ